MRVAPIGSVETLTAAFTLPGGAAGAPVGIPTWSFSDKTVWNPAVAADGLSAVGPLLAEGSCDIQITGEGDAQPGKDRVVLTAQIRGTSPEISGGTATFTGPGEDDADTLSGGAGATS